jgi:Major Facilitator Superfamily
MIMLDSTVVNVALPSMRRSLGLELSQREWVVAGYPLTFAAFMLIGGKLADLLGRRFIFTNGRLLIVSAHNSLLLRREADGSLVRHADLSGAGGPYWNEVVVDGRGNAFVNNAGFDFAAGEEFALEPSPF